MKIREVYRVHTLRTIWLRAFFAVMAGLLTVALVALIAGPRYVSSSALVIIFAVPFVLALVQLARLWLAADTERKLTELPSSTPLPKA